MKDFVTYYQSKELIRLGIEDWVKNNDECVLGYYQQDTPKVQPVGGLLKISIDLNKDSFNAFTNSQALRFFREKYKLSGYVKHRPTGVFTFVLQKHNGDSTGWTVISSWIEKNFNTYEEAENNLINSIIENII